MRASDALWYLWGTGAGEAFRQPGQVRKSAAVTECFGSRPSLPLCAAFRENVEAAKKNDTRTTPQDSTRQHGDTMGDSTSDTEKVLPTLLPPDKELSKAETKDEAQDDTKKVEAQDEAKKVEAQDEVKKAEAKKVEANILPKQAGERLVLARAYRPRRFEDLIGQDQARRIVENALRSGRLHHAILLSGPRGTGKTTMARLIARAVNCKGNKDGSVDPCGVCSACEAMARGEVIDVVEIDAASHTGVDGVREIVDGAGYRPVMMSYRVYIIDEVHMLSRAAFNALLKTLEEPPPHLRFLFATTEVEKVPLTVLSRCLRLELKRLDSETLARHYSHVSEQEGWQIEREAALAIAHAAEGSVRDGLSLLDCAMVESEGKSIVLERVRRMLFLSDGHALYDLLEAIVGGDLSSALGCLDALMLKGAQAERLLREVMERLHRLSRLKVEGGDALLLEPSDRERGGKIAEGLSLASLSRLWQIALRGYEELRLAPHPRSALDMVVVRLVSAAGMPLPQEVLARLARGGDASSGQKDKKEEEKEEGTYEEKLRETFPGATIEESAV